MFQSVYCNIPAVKTPRDHYQSVLVALKEFGVLLESDPRLPSVCTLITGEVLHGSWWSHPLSHTIFQVNEQLADHRDVLITKLVSGKVTFMHRRLWANILAIGTAAQEWQFEELNKASIRLFELVESSELLQTDSLRWSKSEKTKPSAAACELEQRLLLISRQVHTESGRHAKILESWSHWAKDVDVKGEKRQSLRQ